MRAKLCVISQDKKKTRRKRGNKRDCSKKPRDRGRNSGDKKPGSLRVKKNGTRGGTTRLTLGENAHGENKNHYQVVIPNDKVEKKVQKKKGRRTGRGKGGPTGTRGIAIEKRAPMWKRWASYNKRMVFDHYKRAEGGKDSGTNDDGRGELSTGTAQYKEKWEFWVRRAKIRVSQKNAARRGKGKTRNDARGLRLPKGQGYRHEDIISKGKETYSEEEVKTSKRNKKKRASGRGKKKKKRSRPREKAKKKKKPDHGQNVQREPRTRCQRRYKTN